MPADDPPLSGPTVREIAKRLRDLYDKILAVGSQLARWLESNTAFYSRHVRDG